MENAEHEQQELYAETRKKWLATLKRAIHADKEERQQLREEADRLKKALEGYQFNPPDTQNNLNEQAHSQGGERGGKLYGASHAQNSEQQNLTLVLDKTEKDCGSVELERNREAGSLRPSKAQRRPASAKPLVIYEGDQLNGSEAPTKFKRCADTLVICQPDSAKVDEMAQACVRMFGGEPISTRKKCASKIYNALKAGISEQSILFEIEDSAEQGREPIGLFCYRMNKLIGTAQQACDKRSINARY